MIARTRNPSDSVSYSNAVRISDMNAEKPNSSTPAWLHAAGKKRRAHPDFESTTLEGSLESLRCVSAFAHVILRRLQLFLCSFFDADQGIVCGLGGQNQLVKFQL